MDNRSFNTRRRLFVWSPVLLASTAFVCTGLSLWMLYGSFRQEHEQLLTHELAGQLRLLETIGGSNNWDREKTLKAFVDSNAKHPRLGETGEYTLACREGDRLHFLLQKHPDASASLQASTDTTIAEPMRKALEGNAGTLIGKDYRGVEVLAAYAPVPHCGWGLVAKIDASEFRSPLLTTAVAAISVVMLLVIGGGLLIVQLGRPLIRDLEANPTSDSSLAEEALQRTVGLAGSCTRCNVLGSSDELVGYAMRSVQYVWDTHLMNANHDLHPY